MKRHVYVTAVLPALFICFFACANTDPQITKTLLEQQFTQIFAVDSKVDYTLKESYVADLTADGVAEGLVTYVSTPTYESGGGNWYSEGTVIFYADQDELKYFEVIFPNISSGKGFGSYAITGISDGIIHVTVLSYADDDPYCCPTVETKHKFRLVEKELVEVQ